MTWIQTYALAYGIIFLLLGLPLIFVVSAMRRQIKAGNISREIEGKPKRYPSTRTPFMWGLLVAFLFAAKGAFASSQNLLGIALLAGSSLVFWQLYRRQQGNSSAKL